MGVFKMPLFSTNTESLPINLLNLLYDRQINMHRIEFISLLKLIQNGMR